MNQENRLKVWMIILLLVLGGLWYASDRVLPHFFEAAHLKHQHVSQKDIYYCPMHPSYTSDRPGNCPICGMKLVKREAEQETAAGENASKVPPKEFTMEEFLNAKPGEICLLHKCEHGQCLIVMTEEIARVGKCPHCGEDLGVIIKGLLPAGYGNVTLTPEKQQLIGIKTAAVKKTALEKVIRTAGRIASDPGLYQAEQEYLQAAEALRKAESGTIEEVKSQASKLVDSAKIKLKLLGLSDELIQEIERAGKPDKSLLYLEPGGTAWLYAPIYESEISLVKTGQKLEAELPGTGKKFSGVIRAIDSVLDPATRSVRIRAVLDNSEGALKPEMYMNVTIRMTAGNVLAVPREAVFSTGEKDIVFTAKGNGLFVPREVELGVRAGENQEVLSGISEGETVVISGNFLIDSESRLKGSLEQTGADAHHHGT